MRLISFRISHAIRRRIMGLLGVGLLLTGLVFVVQTSALAEDSDYNLDFEIPEATATDNFKIWGYSEFRPFLRLLDKDSALYKQRYFKNPQPDALADFVLNLRPEISWNHSQFGLYIRPRLEVNWSEAKGGEVVMDEPSETFFEDDAHWSGEVLLEEGFATWRPTPSLTVEAGKKVLNWGKGYAWNPVAFASRPKDVDDPDRAREGYFMSYLDAIKSFDGPLTTMAATPLALPVGEKLNEGLASGNSLLYGAKIYALLYDVDLDFLFMAGNNYDTRFGFDFSTNITSNLEIHGEAALRLGYDKEVISAGGTVRTETYDAMSALFGLRYLNAYDTTFIAEYYHNGEGYSPRELNDYYNLIEQGYRQYMEDDESKLLKNSSQVADSYNRSSVGRDYFYFRVSQKEPFDILYLTPTLTVITNVGDWSCSLNPEISYMVRSDLEIKPRLILPLGASRSEFGEKVNAMRGELRLTYYF